MKELESGIVLGWVFPVLVWICIAPSVGLAKEEVPAGNVWSYQGDSMKEVGCDGEPEDGLDNNFDRETGDPVDGLDLTTNYTICYPAETNPELEIWLFFQCCLIPW